VLSSFGTHNTISYNTIDGRALATVTSSNDAGADDGILLADESWDVIASNTIRNTWDAGIEWTGHLDQVQITGNQISNTLNCAIGGWYWSALSNCVISDNVATKLPVLLEIGRNYGLRAAGYDPRNPSLAETKVYFTNNTFAHNVLADPTLYEGLNRYQASGLNFLLIQT
jgi:hypothetical protein